MQVPKILHLCSIKGRGGTGYMAGRLARLCAERGAGVIVGACPGSKIMERSRAAGLRTLAGLRLRRGFRPWSLVNDIKRVRACLREEGINIIHAWHSIEYWTAALALMGMPEPRAGLVRTRGLMTPVRAGYFNRFLHNRTALVHVTCSRILELYRQGGFAMDKVRLIYDGVDTKKFHPRVSGSAARKQAGIPVDSIILASVGRLEKVKGHATLLQAVKLLAKDFPKLQVMVAGGGSLREKLGRQAQELGIERRIHFLGVRNDIPEILAASHIYVLTSIGSEGSSRATLEAMSVGRPVVASNVGMLPDLVQENRTGYLFPPGDAGALAEKLSRLIKDKQLRNAMGLHAHLRAEKEFDENLFAQKMMELYAEVSSGLLRQRNSPISG